MDANSRAREVTSVSGGHLGGITMMNEAGNVVGKVDKVILNEDLSVAAYHTASGLLGLGSGHDVTPEEVISAGPDAIVVRNHDGDSR
jgi:hypothetical protein